MPFLAQPWRPLAHLDRPWLNHLPVRIATPTRERAESDRIGPKPALIDPKSCYITEK